MHTFCKSKIEQAQQPPSMEGQTHLTLGNKKNEPSTMEKEREEKTNKTKYYNNGKRKR